MIEMATLMALPGPTNVNHVQQYNQPTAAVDCTSKGNIKYTHILMRQ